MSSQNFVQKTFPKQGGKNIRFPKDTEITLTNSIARIKERQRAWQGNDRVLGTTLYSMNPNRSGSSSQIPRMIKSPAKSSNVLFSYSSKGIHIKREAEGLDLAVKYSKKHLQRGSIRGKICDKED